jgi:hypothetical protein
MADVELSIDEVRSAAERAGLSLNEDELAKLQRGAGRQNVWNAAVRAVVSPEDEPAVIFRPQGGRP